MVDFRANARGILKRVARGERLILSHRGKPAARLEPIDPAAGATRDDDPWLTIGRRATPSPKGPTDHGAIDRLLYHGG